MGDHPFDHLVCYDIREPRRLRRVHKRLCGWGTPLQYSVFHAKLTARSRQSLASELDSLIDPRQDDVRVYALQPRAAITYQGPPPLPPGLYLDGIRLEPHVPRGASHSHGAEHQPGEEKPPWPGH